MTYLYDSHLPEDDNHNKSKTWIVRQKKWLLVLSYSPYVIVERNMNKQNK